MGQTEKNKKFNYNLLNPAYYLGIVALIFICLIPIITADISYFFDDASTSFLNVLFIFYMLFIFVGSIYLLYKAKTLGKMVVTRFSMFYSLILFFITLMLFVWFVNKSQNFYFAETIIFHVLISILGVITNCIVVNRTGILKPDKPKTAYYLVSFLSALVAIICSIVQVDSFNYNYYLGGWAPSILIFGLVLAISARKLSFPLSSREYDLLSNRGVALQKEIQFPSLSSLPAVFLLFGATSLFIEKEVFANSNYFSGGSYGFIKSYIVILFIISIILLIRRSSYLKKQALYIATRQQEAQKKEQNPSKSSPALNYPKPNTPAVDPKDIPWFMPRMSTRFNFNNQITFEEVMADFSKYSSECGLYLRESDVRAIFASLATSKFLIFNGSDKLLIDKVIAIISGYFGSKLYIQEETQSWLDKGWVVESDSENEKVSEVVKAIYLANVRRDSISILEFNDVVFDNFDDYFASVLTQACNKHENKELSLKVNKRVREESFVKNGKMQISNNLFFAINLARGESLENATSLITKCSTVINIENYDFEDVEIQPKEDNLLSYRQFEVLVESAWDELFVGEAIWRKIDRVAEYLNQKLQIKIDNPTAIASEKFLSVYLALGGSEEEAVDRLISSYLLHKYSYYVADMLSEDVDGVYSAVDNAFGIDNMPFTDEYIKIFRLAKHEDERQKIIKKGDIEILTEEENDYSVEDYSTVTSLEEGESVNPAGQALEDLVKADESVFESANQVTESHHSSAQPNGEDKLNDLLSDMLYSGEEEGDK